MAAKKNVPPPASNNKPTGGALANRIANTNKLGALGNRVANSKGHPSSLPSKHADAPLKRAGTTASRPARPMPPQQSHPPQPARRVTSMPPASKPAIRPHAGIQPQHFDPPPVGVLPEPILKPALDPEAVRKTSNYTFRPRKADPKDPDFKCPMEDCDLKFDSPEILYRHCAAHWPPPGRDTPRPAKGSRTVTFKVTQKTETIAVSPQAGGANLVGYGSDSE